MFNGKKKRELEKLRRDLANKRNSEEIVVYVVNTLINALEEAKSVEAICIMMDHLESKYNITKK